MQSQTNTQMTTLLKTILAATFLMSAGATFAQDDEFGPGNSGQRGHRGPHGMQGMPAVEQMMRAIHRLDISDEQRADMRAIMQEMKTEVRPVVEEIKTSHLQLRELIKADEFDEGAVAELAAEEGDLVAERMVITSRALSEVYGSLTGEQRVELDEMAALRMERRNERREKRVGED